MKFADLPPTDRWITLDRELPALIAAHTTAAGVDPSDEVSVADLAKRHGIGEAAMVKRLRKLGGSPYKIGEVWHIRRKSLVVALEAAEQATP